MRKGLNEKATSVSLKYGILAVGMGGCSIGAELANVMLKDNSYPYKALLINTNLQDFNKLNIKNKNGTQKIALEGYEDGAGRDISVGQEAFQKNSPKILEAVKKQFEDRDFIWIVAGLGGGTGTGAVTQAIQLLHSNGYKKKFGLILTLPMDDEGGKVLENAIYQFKNIYSKKGALGTILVVDNQKIYNDYKQIKTGNIHQGEFLQYCNSYVANILHEINVVTKNYAPLGRDHFDISEFKRLLQEPGFLTLVRQEFEKPSELSNNVIETTEQISKAIEAGVLSDGFDFDFTKRAALALIANENNAIANFSVDLNDALIDMMEKYAGNSEEKPIATYADNSLGGKALVYAAFSGLNMPSRVQMLLEKYAEYSTNKENIKTKADPLSDALAAFDIKPSDSNDDDLLDDLSFDEPSSSNNSKVEVGDDLGF